MDSSEIRVGQTYVDDRGLEVAVYQINRVGDLVVLEGEEGRFEMSLNALAQAIEDGDFAELSDDDGEVDSEEEDED